MKKPELKPLTGLRFYAALLVFLTHVTELPGLERLRQIPVLMETATMGVSIFFVLSGFILTYNYAAVFEPGITRQAWVTFVWHRLCKIYPTHVLTLLIALPLQVFSPNLPLDWRAVPIQLLLLQCFLPFGHPPLHAYLNAPSWSISCEFFFYLLAPPAICVLGRVKRTISISAVAGYAVLLIVCLSIPSIPPDTGEFFAYLEHRYFTYYFAPTRFLEFLGGILMAHQFFRSPAKISPQSTMLFACVAMLLLAAGAWVRQLFSWPLEYAFNYLPGSALLIYVLARSNGWLVRHLSGKCIQLLGMASFSFYLIHMPVIRCVRGIFRHFNFLSPSPPIIAVAVIGTFFAAQVCAIALNWYFEMPLQSFLKSFSGRSLKSA